MPVYVSMNIRIQIKIFGYFVAIICFNNRPTKQIVVAQKNPSHSILFLNIGLARLSIIKKTMQAS